MKRTVSQKIRDFGQILKMVVDGSLARRLKLVEDLESMMFDSRLYSLENQVDIINQQHVEDTKYLRSQLPALVNRIERVEEQLNMDLLEAMVRDIATIQKQLEMSKEVLPSKLELEMGKQMNNLLSGMAAKLHLEIEAIKKEYVKGDDLNNQLLEVIESSRNIAPVLKAPTPEEFL